MSATLKKVVLRLFTGILTIVIATTIVFVLARTSGDPAQQIVGESATEEQVQAKREQLGLDQPLVTQYVDYMGGLVRGDLGDSFRYGAPNSELIGSRLWNSLLLTSVAVGIGSILGYLIALIGALRRDSIWDRGGVAIAAIAQSTPSFWLGLMLIWLFALTLGWFPAGSSGSLSHLVLPALAIGVLPMAQVARVSRSALIGVLAEDYTLAARAKGFGEARVVGRYVVRPTLVPVITVIGLLSGSILSSAVTVEVVFGWPGIGSLVSQAVLSRDFSLLQALVVVGATGFVVINLLVDLLYEVIDPRIRVS